VTSVIPPRIEPDDEYFWAGVEARQLLLQACSDCGALRHPPGPMCGSCHSTRWETQAASGSGTVHAWILSRPPGEPDAKARIVALIDLVEDVRFVSNLRHVSAEDVEGGMAVELFFDEVAGVLLPQFRPVAEGEGA
jgi:uncharacterized OB-fold protein